MGRSNALSYAAIVGIRNELVRSGEKPKIRKIRGRVGGSFSMVLLFYQR